MRYAVLALAMLAAACTPPAQENADAGADAGAAGTQAATEHEALVGVWSFDRSCASGDGMTLSADGSANFDEWGGGTWTADANRVVLTLQRWDPGVGPTGETVVYNLDISATVTDDLVGQLTTQGGGETRAINALRCPE